MSSKGTKGKKPLKESVVNPKLSSIMTQANPKFIMGKSMCSIRQVNLVSSFITTILIIISQVKT
jgi:hypothetical protein